MIGEGGGVGDCAQDTTSRRRRAGQTTGPRSQSFGREDAAQDGHSRSVDELRGGVCWIDKKGFEGVARYLGAAGCCCRS